MPMSRLLSLVPAFGGLRVESIARTDQGLALQVSATRRTALCPLCGHRSQRLHSPYTRTVQDLPWSGTPLTLQILVRRFVCDQAPCPRRIFGLGKDRAAVQAGLTLCWSNGQVEGQVHRLKMLKRQMYGRAGFELSTRYPCCESGS